MVNANKIQKEKYRNLLQVRRREKSENVAYTHLKRSNTVVVFNRYHFIWKERIQQKEYSGLKSKSVERGREKHFSLQLVHKVLILKGQY